MKKLFCLLTVLSLVALAPVVGCGGKEKETKVEKEGSVNKDKEASVKDKEATVKDKDAAK